MYKLKIILMLLLFPIRNFTYSQSALEFSGSDSYLIVDDLPDLHLSEFTLECWIKIKGEGVPDSTGEFGLHAIPLITRGAEDSEYLSGLNFYLGIREEDHVLIADFEGSPESALPFLNHPALGYTSLLSGSWYHVAASYGNSMLNLYVNGKLESSVQIDEPIYNTTIGDLGIAVSFDNNGLPTGFFSGAIDGLRIWNYARSQKELLGSINKELITGETGLVLGLNFNEGQGNTFYTTGSVPGEHVSGNNFSWTIGAAYQAMIPPVGNSEPVLRIGVISDPQYCDCYPAGTRFYRNTLEKLPVAIDTLNTYNLDFVINLGDIIDIDFESYAGIMPLYDLLNAPDFFVLGNHEFSIDDENKDEILGILGMPDYYYSFTYEDWRFLVLDGTELAEYSRILHPELATEGDILFQEVQGQINDVPWNGGISQTQQLWMQQQIEEAALQNQKVILFCHLPVYPDEVHLNMWNKDEIMDLIEQYPNVVAYINGHLHSGNYGFHNRKHYLTHLSMVETEDINSYSVLDIYPDILLQKGFGLNKNRVMIYEDIFKQLEIPGLTDTIMYYSHTPGDFVGRFKLSGTQNEKVYNYYLIGDTLKYDNNLFEIHNDTLLLKDYPDPSGKLGYKIKVGFIDTEFDTASVELNLLFDTIALVQHYFFNDTLLPADSVYKISFDTVFSDFSRNGIEYSVSIADENIVIQDLSENDLLLVPHEFGSTIIVVSAFDPYTSTGIVDSFNISVYYPDNLAPYHLLSDNSQYLLNFGDTLEVLTDTLFTDPNDDALKLFLFPDEFETIEYFLVENFLKIWSNSPVTSEIKITANDNRGGSDSIFFGIRFNAIPEFVSDYTDIILQLTEETKEILLDTLFSDSDDDPIVFSAAMVTEGIANTEVSGGILHITPVSSGISILRITADDTYGGILTRDISVKINASPLWIAAFDTIIMDKSTVIYTILMDTIFFDENSDPMQYFFDIRNRSICTFTVDNNFLNLYPEQLGETMLSIIADDGYGGVTEKSIGIKIVSVSSVKETQNERSYIVYPNPAGEKIFIKNQSSGYEVLKLSITDNQGKCHKVLYMDSSSDKPGFTVSVSDLPSGIYFLEISFENDQVSIHKIIIK